MKGPGPFSSVAISTSLMGPGDPADQRPALLCLLPVPRHRVLPRGQARGNAFYLKGSGPRTHGTQEASLEVALCLPGPDLGFLASPRGRWMVQVLLNCHCDPVSHPTSL